jgi:hypothetical protein
MLGSGLEPLRSQLPRERLKLLNVPLQLTVIKLTLRGKRFDVRNTSSEDMETYLTF